MNWNLLTCSLMLLILYANYVKAGECENILLEIYSDSLCTKILTFKSSELAKSPVLLVALHGDSPRTKPSDQYNFAKLIAKKSKNVVSIGMLRPGYEDEEHRVSDGERGRAVGDNYDKSRVDQIANAIKKLKEIYQPTKVVLVGHSGGSAITAKLIALHHGLVDHAFIISCPCDLTPWRRDMLKLTRYKGFKGRINVKSPLDLALDISSKTKVTLFVGKEDKITQPYLTKAFHAILEKSNKQVELNLLEGGHDIFFNPQVLNSVIAVVNN